MTRMDRGMGQDREPGRHTKDETTRRLVYCVVPARLALALHDSLLEHFSERDDLEVIVERRRRDRRTDAERRRDEAGPPPDGDRRRLRNAEGRGAEGAPPPDGARGPIRTAGARGGAARGVASRLDDAPTLPAWAAKHA